MFNFVQRKFERIKPLLMVVRAVALDYAELKATGLMTIFLRGPTLLHEKHHAMCESVVDLDQEPCPFKRNLCSENAKIFANYAFFFATLPAWVAHWDYKN